LEHWTRVGALDCPEAKLDEEWGFIIWGALLGPGIAVVGHAQARHGGHGQLQHAGGPAGVRAHAAVGGAGGAATRATRAPLAQAVGPCGRTRCRGGCGGQRQVVAGLLQLSPTETQQLELPLDEDHQRGWWGGEVAC
jgi:hypothetical protein